MQFDWAVLGRRAPGSLTRARLFAHYAAQWPSRAARANLEPASDDGHSSLIWDREHSVLFSQPLATGGGDVRVGLRIRGLALVIRRGELTLDTFDLAGRRDSLVGVWLDSALRALGLAPASAVKLPYAMPAHSVARGGAYNCHGEAEALDELALWHDAAAELLDYARTRIAATPAGCSDVRCWPHHFDLAFSACRDSDAPGTAQSIAVGVSPGDEYYSQPYVYVSPSPRIDLAALPPLPPPGQWHTHGFFAAVATGEAVLLSENRWADLQNFVDAALDAGRRQLAEGTE